MRLDIATHAEIPALVELLGYLFKQEDEFSANPRKQELGLRQIIENPNHAEILVLREQNTVMAMVNLLYSISTALGGQVAILEDMVVHPNYRGNGLGSLLINKAIQHAQQKGCLRITLLTDADNIDAHRFYTRHGFKTSCMKVYRLPLSSQEQL